MKILIIAFIIFLSLLACAMKPTGNETESIKSLLLKGKDIVVVGDTIVDMIDLLAILQLHPLNLNSGYTNVRGNIYFQDCVFEQEVTTSVRTAEGGELATQFWGNVSFINCKFEKGANFRSAVFRGAVDFSNTTFADKANFQDATFIQRVNFNGVLWTKEAQLQQTRYYHKVTFYDSRAHHNVMLQGAYFHDDVNMSMTQWDRYVDLSLTRYHGEADINYVQWKDRGVFNNSIWYDGVSIVGGKFGSLSFKGSTSIHDFQLVGEEISGEYIPLVESN